MATVCLMSKCEHNGRIQATGNGINVFWPSWKKLSVKTFCVVLRVKGRRGEREAARWNPADWLQNICARMPNEKKNFSSARQLTSDCCCAGRRPGCQWKTAVHAQQAFPRQITTLQEKFPGRVCQCLSRKKKKNPTTSPFRLLNWPSLSVWIRDHNEMLTIIVSSTPSSPTQLQWATMWMTVALQTRGRVQRCRLSKYRFHLFYVTERWQRWDWFTCEPPTRVWISDICKMMQQI